MGRSGQVSCPSGGARGVRLAWGKMSAGCRRDPARATRQPRPPSSSSRPRATPAHPERRRWGGVCKGGQCDRGLAVRPFLGEGAEVQPSPAAQKSSGAARPPPTQSPDLPRPGPLPSPLPDGGLGPLIKGNP